MPPIIERLKRVDPNVDYAMLERAQQEAARAHPGATRVRAILSYGEGLAEVWTGDGAIIFVPGSAR